MKCHRAKTRKWIFVFISMSLYLEFMLCDIFFEQVKLSTGLKFTSIVLCLVYTIICLFKDHKNKDGCILVGAFLCTVTADVFLLLSEHYEIGVLSFCVVQSIYLVRILRIREKSLDRSAGKQHPLQCRSLYHISLRHLFLRMLFTIVVIHILKFVSITVDFLLCITVFYFLSFISNLGLLGTAWIRERQNQEDQRNELPDPTAQLGNVKLFFIGMILFILCDISVGLYNITDYIHLSDSAARVIDDIVSLGMWGFYLPGQVCIALSGGDDK